MIARHTASQLGLAQPTSAAFMNALMSWLDVHNIGYLGWTWDDWGTTCGDIALIVDYSGTPTTYGQIYKTHLALR